MQPVSSQPQAFFILLILNNKFRNIKESIHILNSWSPFKDAYKSDAPNFMPDNVRDQNQTSRMKREKARPPTPPAPKPKVDSMSEHSK